MSEISQGRFKSRRVRLIIAVVVLMGIGAAGIGYYYYYQGEHYIKTEDARVAGDLMAITPEFAGKIISWNVEAGDAVKAGQTLGMLDTSTAAGSLAASLATVPGIMASLTEKANIVTPITGTVIQSNAKVGQMASQAMPLAVVADLGRVYISANIDETRFHRLHPGDSVIIKVDAFPNKVYQGRVDSIGQATASTFSILPTQNTSGNYTKVVQRIPVKINLEGNITERLLPGMNAYVKIILQKQGQPVPPTRQGGGLQ